MMDEYGWTALHYFARSGDYELVQSILDRGTDINLNTIGGQNCLHIAALHGHLNLCKALINGHNFDVHLADNDGCTVIHHSVSSGSCELVTYFADMGTDIYCKNNLGENCLHIASKNSHLNLCKKLLDQYNFDVLTTDKKGQTALHHSAISGSYELFIYFVAMGTDIECKNNLGWNSLHLAARYGHFDLCKILVNKHKFNVQLTDKDGWKPLHHSARSGSYELLTYFVHMGSDIESKNNLGWNCLHIAAQNGHLELSKKLIDRHKLDLHLADKDGWTALHHSAISGSYELFIYFVAMGTDIECKNNLGWNSLHLAARYGHFDLCKILVNKHKFNVQLTDKDGWKPLHHSARSGSYELLTYFVHMGSDIESKNNLGWNCLHIAAQNGHLELSKKLIDRHKLDLHLADKDGWTALHHSAKNGSYELVTFFVGKRIDIKCKNNFGENSLHIAASYGHVNLCKRLIRNHDFDVELTDNDGWKPLHHSARSGSYCLFKYFADMGTDIDCENGAGLNCLHIATKNKHLDFCKKLIKRHKFDMDLPDYDGWTALHHSARNGSYELVKYFADMGADINLKDNLGMNCLHIAAKNGHSNLCKTFIDQYNFDIETADNEGLTALHVAARNGSYDLVKYYIDIVADLKFVESLGLKCLHIAAENGDFNLCKRLIDNHNVDCLVTDNKGWTALHHSVISGSYKLVKYFADMGVDIECKNALGWNCLHIAAQNGHLKLCQILIDRHNLDIHTADKDGWTAIHHSARNGSYELVAYFTDMGTCIDSKVYGGLNCLHIAAQNGHLNLCRKLVDKHNFDIDLTDYNGWTALHHSARNGSYELFAFIVGMGIDIECKNNSGENSLHIAARYGHFNLCKRLINEHKFDVQLSDNDGWRPLHHSARSSSYRLFKYFVIMGTDSDCKTDIGLNCLHIATNNRHLHLCEKLIDKHNFDVDMPDFNGWAALHHSARNGSYDLVKYFGNRGADINLADDSGMNCLHIAAKYGHLNLCKTLIDKYKLDVDMKDNEGQTALHISAQNGSYDLVKFFVDMGAEVKLKDNSGMNCLHIAAKNGHLNLCKTLIVKYKFDVGIADNEGQTALHVSTRNGSYELVKYFTDMGTDINLEDNSGLNCLHIAAKNGYLDLCTTLINKYKFDVDNVDNEGRTALHISAKNGSYDLVRCFADMGADINLKDNSGMNCLHIAAKNVHLNLCKTLIEKYKFEVDMADSEGRTALHIAAENHSYDLIRYFTYVGADINLDNNLSLKCLYLAAQNGDFNLCKKFIEKCNIDCLAADNKGWKALHHSARNGSYELIKYFADIGTDIKSTNKLGWNCLHIAAQNGHLKLCQILIDRYNLDIYLADKDGWTALHHSARNGSYELVTYFTDMGTDIKSKVHSGLNCLHIAAQNGHLKLCKKLIDIHNFDVNVPDYDGWTALHHSAKSGSFDLFTYFVNTGSDIECTNDLDWNSLHIAARYGHFNLCKSLVNKHKFNVLLTDNDGWIPLHHSARSGSYWLLKYFVDIGTNIGSRNNLGWNCLHIAAKNGHLNLCRILMDKYKLHIYLRDYNGWTALHHCTENGSYDLVKAFAGMGADINLQDNSGMNCLHIAAKNVHLNLCKTLIEKYKFEVDMADSEGRTALHIAAENRSYDLIRYFTYVGADINLDNNLSLKCLYLAAQNGDFNLCKKFIEKCNVDCLAADNKGWKALHHSARNGSYELIKYFADIGTDIKSTNKLGWNCLHIAAQNGHLKLCQILIDRYNLVIYLADKDGWTALHHSARNGSYELVTYFTDMGTDIKSKVHSGLNCLHIAAQNGHLKLCKKLIDIHNFDVNVPDYDGWTALHHSARSGSYELFTYFVDMETDIECKNNLGENALHIAARYGHFNICKSLVNKHKFDVEQTDNGGLRALHHSARSGSHWLFEYFADISNDIYCQNYVGWNCLHIAADNGHLSLCQKLIDKYKFDVDMGDNKGRTALHLLARKCSYDLVRYFADKGADINLKDNSGMNCLHIAAHYGNSNLCKRLVNEHNFDVHLGDNKGWTAFHYSAKRGSTALITYFADIGADISCKTDIGWNCLHIAANERHLDLCKTLIDKYKFDVDMTDSKGRAAVHISVRDGSYDLVRYFADMGTDINLEDNSGMNCLHIAAKNGHLNICKTLMNYYRFVADITDNKGRTALHHSARSGSYDLFRYFAYTGLDINLVDNSGLNCLHIAAQNGKFNLCKNLIDKYNFDCLVTDNKGWAALHHSARNGSYKLVKYFARLEIDIGLVTNSNMNCLHIAAYYGNLNLCKALVDEFYFDVHMSDKNGWSAHHHSARNGGVELIAYFADMVTNIKSKTKLGWNCLHIAALYGHLKLCKELLDKYKFDVGQPDHDGWTALHHSARIGSYELVNLFTDMGTDIDSENKLRWNALHIAAKYGHFELCKKLINKYNFDMLASDNDGWTVLHHSARKGSYELINFFVDMGSDIMCKNNIGLNCLHVAARYGHLNLCRALVDQYNFSIHMSDKKGWTALHHSAKSGNYELVTYFADLGTDIHCISKLGRNCLHIAAKNGHLNLCKTLIHKHKFDVHMADNKGWTTLHHSASSGLYELVTHFAAMGNDIHSKDNSGKNCLHIAARNGHINLCKILINKHGFDVKMGCNEGYTALHYSVVNGSYEQVTYFVGMGTDIHLKTNNGTNCLHIAAKHGHLNLCKTLIDKYGFDTYMQNNEKWTALHFSAENGSFDLFLYILRKGSDIYCKTNKMENVLHLSARKGHFDICNFVLEYFTRDYKDNNSRSQYTYYGIYYSSQIFYKYNTIFLHAMDVNGNTYLHLAAEGKNSKVCELLLKYDTEIITLLNKRDETSMNIAEDNWDQNVLNTLKAEYDRAGMLF